VQVEFLHDDDIERVNAFHNAAYGVSRSLAQWRWEFSGRIGDRRPFVVAKEGGRIVGTQALMPITMVTPEGTALTAKSEETLLDSSMRGKGVFPALYAPLLELAARESIQAIWGFTPASKPFQSVGFSVPARTQQLLHPISARAADVLATTGFEGWRRHALRLGIAGASLISATRASLGPSAVPGVRLAVLEQPPTEGAALSHEFVRTWGGATIFRDTAYLRWRFYENPSVRATLLGAYRGDVLIGWIAYSLDRHSVGYIVDALIPRRDDSRAILQLLCRSALRTLRASGAVAVRGWHLNGHSFDQLLLSVARSLGFYLVRRGEPVVLRIEEHVPVATALRTWDQWFVTRAYTQGDTG
jgi:GNAT superfamily N-acetyltransferase